MIRNILSSKSIQSVRKNSIHIRLFSTPVERICPNGLDCSKYEFQYIGNLEKDQCCKDYVNDLVSYYNEESTETESQCINKHHKSVSKTDF